MTPKPLDNPLLVTALGTDPPAGPLVSALLDPDDRSKVAKEFVADARAHLQERHDRGDGGQAVARAWSGLADHLVAALFEALVRQHGNLRAGLAVVALGGYGRAELSPRSDLDLLVLHGGDHDVGPLVEGLLYPLWDAGLDVQGVARTLEENRTAVGHDVRSRTSLLEARRVVGDPRGFRLLDETLVLEDIMRRGVDDFVEAKLAEGRARRHRYGDTVYILEPNVKEGEGGLRDIQNALWIAQVSFGVRPAGELARRGLVPAREIEALASAVDFLLRIRNHLHFLAGRREDRLTYELQDEIAPAFGFVDEGSIQGVERFLQAYYANANRVVHYARSIIRRARTARRRGPPPPKQELAPGLSLEGDQIHLDPAAVVGAPRLLLEAFEAAQEHDGELSPEALECVRAQLSLVDDRFRRDPEVVSSVFRILGHPRRVATTLMAMHDVGLLERVVPEFGHIRGRAQRDLYHVYPADVHSLFAVQELRLLTRGEYAETFPDLTRLMGQVKRPHILYLAALLHDVGKGHGSRHAERGAEMVLAVADRMDLSPIDREYLEFLVRHHLSLSHIAQGRDLHDEDLIGDFAREVGDTETLEMLYLLTFADIRAVGPGAWTAWKGLLCRELFEKTRDVLGGAGTPRDETRRVAEVAERLRRETGSRFTPEQVEAYLAGVAHPRYLVANPGETLLRHLEVFVRRGERPALARRQVPGEGYDEVILVTRDRPGLFAAVAGVLAAHRMNVLSAVLNGRNDGWVVDVFHLDRGAETERVAEGSWQSWCDDLEGFLGGDPDTVRRVKRALETPSGLRRPRPTVAPGVTVDNRASRRYTVVDLKAADRIGLLHDVARTLSDQGLTIQIAKISTTIEQVTDAFYVEALGGGKVENSEAIERLRRVLTVAAGGGGR